MLVCSSGLHGWVGAAEGRVLNSGGGRDGGEGKRGGPEGVDEGGGVGRSMVREGRRRETKKARGRMVQRGRETERRLEDERNEEDKKRENGDEEGRKEGEE